MTTEKKDLLLHYIESEIQKAKENALKADEASKLIVSGSRRSGDKDHLQNVADLAQLYVSNLEKLKKEIVDAKNETADVARPVCYIEIKYDDGSNLDFYLVDNAVSLTQFLFVSVKLPLGKAILGKKVGDNFNYVLEDNVSKRTFSAKVLKIE